MDNDRGVKGQLAQAAERWKHDELHLSAELRKEIEEERQRAEKEKERLRQQHERDRDNDMKNARYKVRLDHLKEENTPPGTVRRLPNSITVEKLAAGIVDAANEAEIHAVDKRLEETIEAIHERGRLSTSTKDKDKDQPEKDAERQKKALEIMRCFNQSAENSNKNENGLGR